VNGPYGQRALIGVSGGTARLMAYSLLAITLMALDFRGRYVDQLRDVATQFVEPLVLVIDLPFHGADRLVEFWTQRTELVERIRQLERDAVRQNAMLGDLADLAVENARLRELLDAAPRPGRRFLAAELAAIDLDPFAHRIVIKRGRVDGVDVGMPVIDAGGVLGQIEQTDRNTSRVILLTDPDHALPVQILPAGERTVAYGSGRVDRLRLNDLPMNTAVEVGDLVVTSGLGGRFTAGLPVGRLVALERPAGQPFARAEVEPLAAMDRNRMVLVLQAVPAPSDESDAGAAAAEVGESADGAADGLAEPVPADPGESEEGADDPAAGSDGEATPEPEPEDRP
jgi:rod shape-determining protein MreC